jgi:phosphatidate cytidylyltransferase
MPWVAEAPVPKPGPNAALRERLRTAAWLIPAIVAVVLLLPTPWFAVVMGLIVSLAAREWAVLTGIDRPLFQAALVGVMAVVLLLLWIEREALLFVLAAAVAWWLLFAALMPRLRVQPVPAGADPALLALALPVLAPAWLALVHLHGQSPGGRLLVLGLIGMIALADSAAYLVGSRLGRRKLAPRLSPGKTWEGLLAALIAAGLSLLLAGVLLGLSPPVALLLMLLGAVTVALSVVGDLFESWLKRRRGRKDSGALLPGHGGVLDRIDSMTAAAPVFALGLILLGLAA